MQLIVILEMSEIATVVLFISGSLLGFLSSVGIGILMRYKLIQKKRAAIKPDAVSA